MVGSIVALNHKGDRTLAACEADEQPTRVSLSAIWVAPEVSDEDVAVSEELLRLADGDATPAELVQSLLGREELMDDVGHAPIVPCSRTDWVGGGLSGRSGPESGRCGARTRAGA